MRLRKILICGAFCVGLLAMPFAVAKENNAHRIVLVPIAYAQTQTAVTSWSPRTLWDTMMVQIGGVFSFAAQAIEAVSTLPDALFDDTTSSENVLAEETIPVAKDPVQQPFVPSLSRTQTGSLVVNVPFIGTNKLTITGDSILSTTTISKRFEVLGKSALASLVVSQDSNLGSLFVSGITRVQNLTVQRLADIANLSVSQNADVRGVLTARGGIVTNGADVNLGTGNVFAANIINSITAGKNVTITGTPSAPIISVRSMGGGGSSAAVTSLNGQIGALTLLSGDDIVVSGLTISSDSTLASVRLRGGCVDCITDADVLNALTIAGGTIDNTVIGSTTPALGFFTTLSVSHTATSTFGGSINVTSGCVAVNGVCLGGGVSRLNDLLDVVVAAPATGEILLFDGALWNNVATSSLGFGDNTFLGLRDTPSSFVPLSLSFVNASGTALTQSANLTFDGNVFGLIGVIEVSGGATSTFGGSIDVTSGCVAVNGVCLSNGATQLSDLSDVALSAPTAGDVFLYNGSSWVDVATSSLGLGNNTFLGLRDTPSSYIAQAVLFANGAATSLSQSANFVFDGTRLAVGTSTPVTTLTVAGTVGVLGQQAIRFYDANNSNYVSFKASSTVASNVSWTLPTSDGSVNQLLTTDGAGNLRFANVSAVGGGSADFLGLTDTVDTFINKAIPYVATGTLSFSSNFVFDGVHVGIGTNSPTSELTVRGGVRFEADASNPGLVYEPLGNTVAIGTENPTERFTLEGGSMLQRGAAPGDTYSPTQTDTLDLPDNANDVQVMGTYAYVVTASGGNEFHIIDITNTTASVEVGSVDLPATANALYVSGKYAYVVTDISASEFQIVDVSNPSTPTVAGTLNLPTTANDVFVLGRYAYVVTGGTGDDVHVIDISNPASPREVGSLNLVTGAYSIHVSGRYAYIAMDTLTDEFLIVDVGTPSSPVAVGSLNLPSTATDLFVQGGYAFVVTSGVGNDFHIINISNPAAPTEIGSLNLVTGSRGVTVAGDYAYVVTDGTGDDFHIVDISNPAAPVEVGSRELASGTGLGVTVAGRYVYAVTSSIGDDFHIIDISGIETQSLFAHSLQSGTISTLGSANFAGNVTLGNGLRGGAGGLQTDGSLFVQGTSSSFFLNKLGVGTTTPSRTLTVGGDLRVTGAIFDSVNTAGINGYILKSVASGTRWVATSTLGFASSFSNSAQLGALLSDESGTGSVVFSTSPTFTGTLTGASSTFSSRLTLSGTSANIALGSNYLSGDGGDEGVYVDVNGNIGIGTTTPQQKLSVVGTIGATNLLGGATSLSTDAQGNIIRTPSDERLKTDIVTIDGALEKLLALRGVTYSWQDTERFGDQLEIGFLAQEVDLIIPEAVRKGGEYWSLNTSNIVAVVVEGIKELWSVVQGNQEQIELLQKRVDVLESALQQAQPSSPTEDATPDEDTPEETATSTVTITPETDVVETTTSQNNNTSPEAGIIE